MSQVIAGLYELGEKIGAGGGGVVYLGKHLRLNKRVVLKADKRTLNTGAEALQREVHVLKKLSHTYIPQVYDFVQEDGVVYTVMDFIEGESLDKLLARKERPSQPQVIDWACQLLDALIYLHGRPPHGILHGDIKPANIMLRPDGGICLIDFNIALALGENGAVKVGFSRGYASPEHYGADYISSSRPAAVASLPATDGRKKKEKRRSEESRAGGRGLEGIQTGEETEVTQTGEETEATKAGEEAGDAKAREEIGVTKAEEETEAAKADEETEATKAGEETEATETDEKTEVTKAGEETGTARKGTGASSTGSSTTGRGGILLDVRSDIYSLGATLYHLLSGVRPAQNAREVKPLGPEVCSPAVSAILQKAMAPEPGMRYQSAQEMQNAFLQLHRCDGRAIRHRQRAALSAAMLSVLFLAGGACAFTGLKQLEQRQSALALAEYSSGALAQGNVSEAVRLALSAIPFGEIWDAPVTAQAQKALTDALGVYDLSDGFRPLDTVELPSAPFDIAVSPNGTYFAAVYAYEAAVFLTEDQQKIAVLPVQVSALSDICFPDESTVLYSGEQGVTAYDLNAQRVLWTGETATFLTVSADGQVAAAVNRDADHAVIYRVSDGARMAECSFEGLHMSVAANDIFADPGNYIFALNEDGSMLAVSFQNGGLMIFDWNRPEDSLILYEESEYTRFQGGFCESYFAFSAGKSGEFQFGLVDTVEAVFAGGYRSQDEILLQAGQKGIYLAHENLLVGLKTDTLEEIELAYTGEARITGFSVGEDYVLAATEDHRFSFYDKGAHLLSSEDCGENCDFMALSGDYAITGNRNEPSLRLMKRESHEETQILSYDARYEHEEARLSQDGRTVMLFCYQNFRIYDRDGTLVTERELPDAENIYDQQFVREGELSWLEVIWYDGTVRRYDAADGALLSEEKREAPSRDLYEEFFVGGYRIASSLHEAPQVYERDSGRWVAALEQDSYLTYVTETGGYIITEYISAAGERYGLLLDERLQTLAYLPGLCDIVGDKLVFDYESGDLRQCRLYSLEELVNMGKEYLLDVE